MGEPVGPPLPERVPDPLGVEADRLGDAPVGVALRVAEADAVGVEDADPEGGEKLAVPVQLALPGDALRVRLAERVSSVALWDWVGTGVAEYVVVSDPRELVLLRVSSGEPLALGLALGVEEWVRVPGVGE